MGFKGWCKSKDVDFISILVIGTTLTGSIVSAAFDVAQISLLKLKLIFRNRLV